MNTTPSDENHPHYPWGASCAKTWRGCAGSINFANAAKESGKIPQKSTTKFAEEGTDAHDWADRCIKGEITKKQIPANHRESLDGYIDFARELADEAGEDSMVFTEQQVPLFYNEEETGTLDYSVATSELVSLLDYKNGFQHVAALENDQLIIYAMSLMIMLEAMGLFEFTDDTIIRCYIYQPNCPEWDGVPEQWECTYRDLKDYCIDIKADYRRSKVAKVTDLKPSKEACMFCDARIICTERILGLFEDIPEGLHPFNGSVEIPESPAELTDKCIVAIVENRRAIAKWMEEVESSYAPLRIEQGNPIKGLKLVNGGAGNRSWGEREDEAEKLLRKIPAADRYKPRRVLSPAQAEKVLKKVDKPLEEQSTKFRNRWAELVFRKQGKPVVALESDPRPARASAMDLFDDEDVSEDDCF